MNVYAQILEMRKGIRYARDQKGDDRCWLDDYKVTNALPATKRLVVFPTYDEGMKKCQYFFKNRNANSPDPTPANAILDPLEWDSDLVRMSSESLWEEYTKLEKGIIKFDSIPIEKRTIEHDRELYSLLPEKIPADFRLPCERDFLEVREGATAGCPQFWKSHENCSGEHNIHQWGPCK